MESNMLKNIVQTANYSVSVNPKEQRLYVTMKGCTTQALEPSQYMEELYEIMHSISQGGTALLNSTA